MHIKFRMLRSSNPTEIAKVIDEENGRTMVLMRGLPGMGSFETSHQVAETLESDHVRFGLLDYTVVDPLAPNEDGKPVFKMGDLGPDKGVLLGSAHAHVRWKAERAARGDLKAIIIANPFLDRGQCDFFVKVAIREGLDSVLIVTPDVEPTTEALMGSEDSEDEDVISCMIHRWQREITI